MNLDDICRNLGLLARMLDNRREIWRVIVDAQGNEIKRLYRGSFVDKPRDPNAESHSEGEQS